MRLEHPVFQGPLKPQLELEIMEDGNDFSGDLWRVHTGQFSAEGLGIDVGMVSNGYGFEDSPDCERISGGVNSKGPRAVAIGRQANMLSWGFYGAPDRMTPAALRVFLNTLVYMRRFDGERPLVRNVARSREMIEFAFDYVSNASTDEGDRAQAIDGFLLKNLPEQAVGAHGKDVAALEGWYREHIEFLRFDPEARRYLLDEDLVALGVSNREPAFFAAVAAALEDEQKRALGTRLADRYLPEGAPRDPAALRAWTEEHAERLFFSDVGGYRWFPDPRRQAVSRRR